MRRMVEGPVRFRDRREAGALLGRELARFAFDDAPVVLALPRGGVPVAFEIAKSLRAELDILVIRKLGVPGEEELAMGAIASGGLRILNNEVINAYCIPDDAIETVASREQENIARREQLYRGSNVPVPIGGRDVILVDDGLATGSSMRVAIRAARNQQPKRVIVAVPVGARSTCESVAQEADRLICIRTPEPFRAVGEWYEDFRETSDDEVREYLDEYRDDKADSEFARGRD